MNHGRQALASAQDGWPTGQALVDILQKSGLVNADWYRRIYPDVGSAGLEPVEHFCEHGAAEGRSPNAYFDTVWYLEQYPDVGQEGVNPLLHYILIGAAEGRSTGRWFDTAYYLEQNPDLKELDINPLLHYLQAGRREGRPARRS